MANIFWSYDESEGSFSPLPASPWLLPAIGLFALAALFQAIKSSQPPEELGPMPPYDPILYEKNKTRYYYLIQRKADYGLSEDEQSELNRLIRPPWASKGQIWTY